MELDTDKIDDAMLALLYLVRWRTAACKRAAT
jgi:hypothetical protein